MPKLDAIIKDITQRAPRQTTSCAPKTAQTSAAPWKPIAMPETRRRGRRGYKRYLAQQREQIARARTKAAHDLRIADNTYETVEASFQLRNLMRDSSSSFEAIQRLEAPTFDQIFKNEELRHEFENLTRKLDGPTS